MWAAGTKLVQEVTAESQTSTMKWNVSSAHPAREPNTLESRRGICSLEARNMRASTGVENKDPL